MNARGPTAVAALGVAVLASLGGPPQDGAGGVELSAARGALEIGNSRAGTAILAAPNMQPGHTAVGAVTVVNRGRARGRLLLYSSPPVARRGPGGGSLADVLEIAIDEARGRAVHQAASGTLTELAGCHDLGPIAPGESRAYRFAARFPDGGPRDNGYRGSTARADERWTVTAAGRCGGTAGPRPRLVLPRRARAIARRRAAIRARCVGPAGSGCRGTLRLGGRRSGPPARFDIRAGRARMLRVRLPAAARRALSARRRARVAAVARPAEGSSMGSARRLVTVVSR